MRLNTLARSILLLWVGFVVGIWCGYGFAQYRWSFMWLEMRDTSDAAAATIDMNNVELIDRGEISRVRRSLLAVAKSRADSASEPVNSYYSWSMFAYGPLGELQSRYGLEYLRSKTSEDVPQVRARIAKACEASPSSEKKPSVCGR